MRAFSRYNPITVFTYFIAVLVLTMFGSSPMIAVISFAAALTGTFFIGKRVRPITHLIFGIVFLVTALINPLVNHNGVTVLFVMNNNPVTLEALLYGIFTGITVLSVLYLFHSFSQIMTADRLQYVFGAFSPKVALLFSMSLRYVPLFAKQATKIRNSQKLLGAYGDDTLSNIRCGGRVFSVMVTWSLENGIITADSMAARGYGIGKRSRYSPFRFRTSDFLLLLLTIVFFAAVIACMAYDKLDFTFYPTITAKHGLYTYSAYAAFAALAFMPTIIEVEERIRWKYFLAKI